MEFPTEDHESFITIPHTFSANRIYLEDESSKISASNITLRVACGPIDKDSMPLDERGKRAAIGFQRAKLWMEAVLIDVILIDVNSQLLETVVCDTSNTVMFIPGQPDDSMLSVVLHAKLSAITKDLLDIYSISLSATDTENIERHYRNLHPAKKYPLPGIEYIGIYDSPMHDKPWWERPTIDVCEFSKDEDGDELTLQFEDNPLAEIGKEYLTNGQEADIIVFDLWKNRDK
jgi:hypothetical protein